MSAPSRAFFPRSQESLKETAQITSPPGPSFGYPNIYYTTNKYNFHSFQRTPRPHYPTSPGLHGAPGPGEGPPLNSGTVQVTNFWPNAILFPTWRKFHFGRWHYWAKKNCQRMSNFRRKTTGGKIDLLGGLGTPETTLGRGGGDLPSGPYSLHTQNSVADSAGRGGPTPGAPPAA